MAGKFFKAGKPDLNQAVIVASLRQIPGVSVAITSGVAGGFGDLVVGYRNRNYIFEIKDPDKAPSDRRLTEAEESFHIAWNGQIAIAMTAAEILDHIGLHGKRSDEGNPGRVR